MPSPKRIRVGTLRLVRLFITVIVSAGLLLAAPDSTTWESLSQLKSGASVEVITRDRAEKGEYLSSSSESLSIRTPNGEQKFLRPDVVRVISRRPLRRLRNMLIGGGIGVAIAAVTDATLGTRLRNESNPENARLLIWSIPIAGGAAIGALRSGHKVIYQK